MINQRNSNIELLRILTMFAILFWHGIHHGFLNIEGLNCWNIRFFNIISWSLFWHVDVFVLISGYFTIKFGLKKLFKFCGYIIAYLLLIDIFIGNYNVKDILYSILILLRGGDLYWFVKPYILLFVMSPLLNLMLKLEDKEFNKIIALFTLVNIVFGFILKSGYNDTGFNVQNFVYLYMLGMSIRRYEARITFRNRLLFTIFIVNILLAYILSSKVLYYNYWYAYNNPFILCNAVIIFIIFSRIKLRNRYINDIALSAFAVYLLTDNGQLTRRYVVQITNLIYKYTQNFFADIAIWLALSVVIFMLCICFDKVLCYISVVAKNILVSCRKSTRKIDT